MSIADIVVIVLVALFAVIGVLKGVQKSALSTGAFLVAFILAFFLAKPIAEALLGMGGIKKFVMGTEGWSLYTWLYSSVGSNLGEGATDFMTKNYFGPIIEVLNTYQGYTEAFTVGHGLALYIAFMAYATVIGIGIFIVARLLLMIVTMIVKSFVPKRKSAVNRLFGFIVGAVRGAVWSLALTIVFSVIACFPFVSTFEHEYEQSVVATHVNTVAYSIRNKFYLPDQDMYARLVETSGLVVVDGDQEEENRLVGGQADIYVALYNLNYENGNACYIDVNDAGKIKYTPDADLDLINTTLFKDTGFDTVMQAIMDYNKAAAESVFNGALKEADNSTLHTYSDIIQDGENSIYVILYESGVNGGSQPLINKLKLYQMKIDETKNAQEESVNEECNRDLIELYNAIESDFLQLKELYNTLSPTFGQLNFTLPEVVQIPFVPQE